MQIQITFDPQTINLEEWERVNALVAQLRGDSFAFGTDDDAPVTEGTATAVATPQIPAVAVSSPAQAAEALMQVAVATKIETGVDIDTSGIPWDVRIHSKPAVKNADGSWRKKRGVSDDLVATVTAELKAVMAAPPATPVVTQAAPPPPQAAPAIQTEAAPPPPQAAPAIQTEAAPQGNAAPAPMVSGEAVAAPATSDFTSFMLDFTGKVAAGHTNMQRGNEIAAQLGLKTVGDFQARPDLIPNFQALLDAEIPQ